MELSKFPKTFALKQYLELVIKNEKFYKKLGREIIGWSSLISKPQKFDIF